MEDLKQERQPDNTHNAISGIADMVRELGEAKAMLVTGKVSQASYQLEQGVEANPHHCDLWHAYGHTLRDQEQHDQAIDAYSKAIDLAYRYHSLIHYECSAQFLQRAILYLAMGESEKANADLDAAIFQDHNNQPAILLKTEGWTRGMEIPEYTSNLMTETQWRHETDRVLSQLHELRPHQQQHDKAIYFFRHNNMRAAFVIAGELLKQRPEYPMAWHHRALMHLHINETRQAYDDLNSAIEAAEKWHEAYHRDAALHHYHRGEVYARTNQPEMAMMDYNKAVELDKSFPQAYVALARVHANMGQYPTAMAEMEAAIALDDNPEWIEEREGWMQKMGM